MAANYQTSCAVLTPLDEQMDATFASVQEALASLGIDAIRLGSSIDVEPDASAEQILEKESSSRHIVRADLVIADITGSNAKVMYGLGIAHALRKPTLLIGRLNANPDIYQLLPYDLRLFIVFWYEPAALDQLANFVSIWAGYSLHGMTEALAGD